MDKVLSVYQPWAWAIVAGIKPFENRSWKTKYRGRLLIHAGLNLKYQHLFDAELPEWGVRFPPLEAMYFGGIIGQVDLVDIVPVEKVRGQRFAEGPFCWVLENAQVLEFVKMPGKQGLWECPESLLAPC